MLAYERFKTKRDEAHVAQGEVIRLEIRMGRFEEAIKELWATLDSHLARIAFEVRGGPRPVGHP